jgi:hypothetical protein
MKLAETLLAACVVGLAGFIGVQSMQVGARAQSEAAGAFDTRAPQSARRLRADAGTRTGDARRLGRDETVRIVPPVVSPVTGMPTNPMPSFAEVGTRRDVRRLLAQRAPGTYIDEILRSRDSSLARWPERLTRPLRVWVDEAVMLEGWSGDFPGAVRDAFLTWSETGIPVRFDFVRDSTRADIHVRFTDRLPNGISGKTVWSRDARWWLVSSDIQLALVHPSGGTVTAGQMRAIALHEVGHLLGLDHTEGQEHIMAARVRVRDLSEEDRATVRLLYAMPAGSVR